MPQQPRYKTPEEMQEKIDAYFKACEGHPLLGADDEPVLDKFGVPIRLDVRPPTVTGLALALGFTSRQALLNYQAKKAFVDTVTRAKSRVEQYTEERLFDRDGQRGAEFSLMHNFRWGATESDKSGAGGVVLLSPVMQPPPKEEDPSE